MKQKLTFSFVPSIPLDIQIQNLRKKILQDQNLKKICFKEFQNQYRIDHLLKVQSNLRQINTIQQVKFSSTVLSIEHFALLAQWLKQLQCNNFIIKLNNNKVDNNEIHDFLNAIVKGDIQIKKIIITNNPGIYKGQLISELKQLIRQQNANNYQYQYKLVLNKQYLSLAIIRQNFNETQQQRDFQEQKVFLKISKLNFFSFSFNSTFTQINFRALEQLINLNFNENGIDQISKLQISSSLIVNSAIMCEQISTSKGLLKMVMQSQSLLNYSVPIENLMGNRYHKFRVNVLDIEKNSTILEKTYKILSDNIFLHCKQIKFSSSLPQQLSTLYKMFVMTESFQQYSNQLIQQSIEQGKILKQNLRVLDLTSLENYNRHDLIAKFLQAFVFTETSNLKKLTIQNIDIGRTQAYIQALIRFREYIQQQQQKYPFYQNFKLPLKSLKLPNQTYRMEIATMKQFFQEFFFTRVGDILEIEEFIMEKCFRQSNREEGLKENCAEIFQLLQANPGIRYSIKRIKFIESTYQFDSVTYRCLFLNHCFNIEELMIKKDTIAGEFIQFVNETEQFFLNQPLDYKLPLQIITLDDIEDIVFNISDLLQFFVFHDRMKIKKLVLKQIVLLYSQLSINKLEEVINSKDKNQILSLEEFEFSNLTDDVGVLQFFKYVVFNKNIRIKKLKFGNLDFSACVYFLKEYFETQNELNLNHSLQDLNYLKISNVNFEDEMSWEFFLQKFVLHPTMKLKSLKIQQQKLDEAFYQGISQSFENSGEILKLELKELKYKKCEIMVDPLTAFLYTCSLNHLSFDSCVKMDQGLKICMDNYHQSNVKQYNNFKLESFSIKMSKVEDTKIFKWLIKEIALNIQHQQLKKLNLSDCNLSNEHLRILQEQIELIKDNNQKQKSAFKLYNLKIDQNQQISESTWIDFFNVLMKNKAIVDEDDQNSEKTNINQQKHNNNQKKKLKQTKLINDKEQQLSINRIKIEDQQDREIKEKIDTLQKNIIESTLYRNDLNLKQKIINNYHIFTPNFPKQLKQLNLNMNFQELDQNDKTQIYERLISGLIMHPENQLTDLTLVNLNLILFMEKCEQFLIYYNVYQNQCIKNEDNKWSSKLESLSLKSLATQNQKSTDQFVKTFICSQSVNLQKLLLENFNEQLIVSLMNQIDNRQDYKITELTLLCIYESIECKYFNSFVDDIIYCQRFPLQKIELIGMGIQSNNKQISSQNKQLKQIQYKQKQISLKQITVQLIDDQQVKTFISILGHLLQQPDCKLEVIKIQTKAQQENLSSNFFSQLTNELKDIQELNLKEIHVQGKVIFDETFVQFLDKCILSLEQLSIANVDFPYSQKLKDKLNKLKRKEKKSKFTIEIKQIATGIEHFFECFTFNKNIKATNIILSNPQNFTSLRFENMSQFIKSIKLDMGLLYSSTVKLNRDSLTLLSQRFIYNEQSHVEEMLLYQCQLKREEIEAFCLPAAEFREQIIQQQRQGICQLKLKQFSIYYSLYIGEVGCEIISKDLIFFEYIDIERIDFLVTNFNDQMCDHFSQAAKNWLTFQQLHNRKNKDKYPLKYLDIGRNEFVQSKTTWANLLQTLVFTDRAIELSTLNLQFMGFNDETISYLVEQAQLYLNQKPDNYVLPIKKINFSQNNALTHRGWQNLFDNFFLHKKVNLIELNMISTMLDTQIKLNTIYECIQKRALQEPNQKLQLQVFLCYNVSLKNAIEPYLQVPAKDYPKPKNLPVDIDYDSWKYGIFDGIPEEFGSIIMLVNTLIQKRNEFIETNKWKLFEDIRFPNYHLNFHQHYLAILNSYLYQQNNKLANLYLNLSTLDIMCQFFNYTTFIRATPYPYRLIFSEESLQYLSEQQIKLKKLKLIQIPFAKLEQLSQLDVLQIWQQIRQLNIQIQKIEMEYYLNDELIEEMFRQNYNESDLLDLITLIPPAKIRIENTLTLNTLKGFYSILQNQYYFSSSIIKYSFNDWINTGLAYQIREYAYNYVPKTSIQSKLKTIAYNISNWLVMPQQTYIFYNENQSLQQYLDKTATPLFIISLINMFYLILLIILPLQQIFIYSINHELNFSLVNSFQFIILISTIYELYLINNLNQKNKPKALQQILFRQVQDLPKLVSQKCIPYCNAFSIIMYYSSDSHIIFTIFIIIYFFYYLQLLFQNTTIMYQYYKNKKVILQDIYHLSRIGKFSEIEKIINEILPYNSTIIKKTKLTKNILPQSIYGKAIHNKIYFNLRDFILKDLPFLILNTIFIISQLFMNTLTLYQQLSQIGQLVQIYISFKNFISYRPSVVSQDDFDVICKRNQNNYKRKKLNLLQKEKKQLDLYANIYNEKELKNKKKK
ncbi:unnamed protein product [Paramecium pentaurelia]|uniref:Transmembrane protein n=1 Tax=Paramecium pentaurelia TaxID=43138 RepID=A0A8S1WJ58_9CILI|nr:unnamed protein product [Paramecium pentaurelia]